MNRRRLRAIGPAAVAALALLAALRVASTYRVFSQTVDEPIHVASGFQWLTAGRYDLDVEHPPLARILFAAGPAMTGAHVDPAANRVEQGSQILYRGGDYRHNLAQSRAGNLPFFLAAVIAVAIWSTRLGGRAAAVLAVALFGSLPPVLGHAGLATTDMAAAATTVIALLLFWRWLRAPAWTSALALAAAIGIGLVSKFSFPIFFVTGAVVMTVAWALTNSEPNIHARRRVAHVIVIAAIGILTICVAYRLSTGTANEWRLTVFPKDDPLNVAARYDLVPGYEWVRPDIIERYWSYGRYAGRQGKHGVDFVDWAERAGYPSPLAGRSGDTMRNAPPLPPLSAAGKLFEPFRRAAAWFDAHVPLPAPQFASGILYVQRHSRIGHPSYFLGDYRDRGWWYYFPVLFLFKTPIAFTLMAIVGLILLARRGLRERNGEAIALAVVPVAMFIPAMASGINIGIRHILPVYPMLTVAAAYAVSEVWRRFPQRSSSHDVDHAVTPADPAAGGGGATRLPSIANRVARPLAVVLLAWYFISTAVAHPDYLAYYNELAGRHPDRIAVDSNLDWGQDLLRLADAKRRRHIDRLHLAYFGNAIWRDPTVQPLEPGLCTTGWVAISETLVKQGGPELRGHGYRWLDRFEYEEIGRSIRLYRVPVAACAEVPGAGPRAAGEEAVPPS